MTVFVNDTFTETSDVLLQDHAPDTGGAWQKRSGSTDNTVVAAEDNLRQHTSTTFTAYINSATPGSSEYDVEVTPSDFATGRLQLFGRYIDSSNYYRLLQISTTLSLQKCVGGTLTTLDSVAEARDEVAYKLEIRTVAKKGYRDGVEKVTSADDTITGIGNAGLAWYSGASTGRLDNFVATDAGAPSAETAIMQPMKTWWPR